MNRLYGTVLTFALRGFCSVFLLSSFGVISASALNPCSGSLATLYCLSQNFDEVYFSDYDVFWDILNSSAKRAADNRNDLVSFIRISEVKKSSNAEFEEFFSQKLESWCVEKPTYLFDGLLAVEPRTQLRIIGMLQNPLFQERSAIRKAFRNQIGNTKYHNLADLYFADDREIVKKKARNGTNPAFSFLKDLYNRLFISLRKDAGVKYYSKCKALKAGMSESEIINVMGDQFEVSYSSSGPQIGKKILKYINPPLMDGDNLIYIDTGTALASLIYCSNAKN